MTEQKSRELRPFPPLPRPRGGSGNGGGQWLAACAGRSVGVLGTLWSERAAARGSGSSWPPRSLAGRPGESGGASRPRGGSGETPPRPARQRLSLPPAWSRGEWRCRLGASAGRLPELRLAWRGWRVEGRNRGGRAAPVSEPRGADLSLAESAERGAEP